MVAHTEVVAAPAGVEVEIAVVEAAASEAVALLALVAEAAAAQTGAALSDILVAVRIARALGVAGRMASGTGGPARLR